MELKPWEKDQANWLKKHPNFLKEHPELKEHVERHFKYDKRGHINPSTHTILWKGLDSTLDAAKANIIYHMHSCDLLMNKEGVSEEKLMDSIIELRKHLIAGFDRIKRIDIERQDLTYKGDDDENQG